MQKGFIEAMLDYGFSVVFFIAGVFGALASLVRQRQLSFTERMVTILSGGATAAYITPMLIEMVSLSEGSSYGMAFVIGFAGLKMVEWIIAAIRDRLISGRGGNEGN